VIETVVVVAVVLGAAAFLARRAWRLFAPRGGAGCGCGPKPGCPAAESVAEDLREAARRAARRT
jgi:hypothetical protein